MPAAGYAYANLANSPAQDRGAFVNIIIFKEKVSEKPRQIRI
jgi:hypothetical protein